MIYNVYKWCSYINILSFIPGQNWGGIMALVVQEEKSIYNNNQLNSSVISWADLQHMGNKHREEKLAEFRV